MDQERLMLNAVGAAFRAALDDDFGPMIDLMSTLRTGELVNLSATAAVVAESAAMQLIVNDRSE